MIEISEIKKSKIEKIIAIEWEMFQGVDNIGGRASCQEDFETFYIMRFSQYGSWSYEMVCGYLSFAEKCQSVGRNLVTEKYARMMEFTDPNYYEENLVSNLPHVSRQNYLLIDKIVASMVQWEIQFSLMYPKLSAASRPITSDGDATGFTSMETYACGELATYPHELLLEFADYVKKLQDEGKSLSMINQQIMVNLYGYNTIEEAEASL